MEQWIVGIFLGISSISDLKRKEISVIWAAAFALFGIVYQIVTGSISLWQWLGGMLLGIAILGIGAVTRESIGYGDGLVVGVVGIWLGMSSAFEMLFWGLCMAAFVSAVLLVVKKVRRSYQLPFVPFLFLAWCLWLAVLGW